MSDPKSLTKTDSQVLHFLLEDASQSVADIADKVGMSASSCWRRINALQEKGIIQNQTINVSARLTGLRFTAISSVKLALPSEENMKQFEQLVLDWPEVLECFTVSGAVDYMMRVVTTDMEAYDRFLRSKLLRTGIVSDVQSRIVVTEVKNTNMLPLNLVTE